MQKSYIQQKQNRKRRFSFVLMVMTMIIIPVSRVFSNPPPPPPGDINTFPVYRVDFVPTLEDGTMFLIGMGVLYLSYKLIQKSNRDHSPEQG